MTTEEIETATAHLAANPVLMANITQSNRPITRRSVENEFDFAFYPPLAFPSTPRMHSGLVVNELTNEPVNAESLQATGNYGLFTTTNIPGA